MNEGSARTVGPGDRLGMTEAQWEQFQAHTQGFGEQDGNGVDLSLLRENLRLTPEQRVDWLLRLLALWSESMSEPQPVLGTLLAALAHHGVRHLLIGGVAMRCHGSAHITDDVDLYYGRDAENLARLTDALTPLHPRLRGVAEALPFRWDARTLSAGLNFTLVTDVGNVDLLGEVPGADPFDTLWQRSATVDLFGIAVRVASLDDLIRMKRAAGRTKDQLHLIELEALRALTTKVEDEGM